MDTVQSVGARINKDNGENVLTRKEIRRQKLMEYLAAKANLSIPRIKPNVDKNEVVKSDRSPLKMAKDKENKILPLKTFQSTYTVKRPPLSLKNTANTSCNKPCEKQNSEIQSTTRSKDQKAYQIPDSIRTYNINHKSSPSAVGQNPHAALKPAKNTNICVRATSTHVRKAADGRMFHGPIVKTRTGLMPAVIQPKSSKSQFFTTTNESKISTNKAPSSVMSQRPSSQASNTSVRKPTSTVVHKLPKEQTVGKTDKEKSNPQNKCSTAPLTKHTMQKRNNNLSDGPRPPVRSTTKSVKLETKERTTRTNSINSYLCSQAATSKTKSCQGKPTNTVTSAWDHFKISKTVTGHGHGGKRMDPIGTQKNITSLSKPIFAPGVSKQRKMPSVSQTPPQPPRTVNFTNKLTGTKTPHDRAPPQTVQKPLTAAEERIKKLQEWREARGISYKRPPMFVKTQARRTIAVLQPFWSNMEQEDEAHSVISAVDRSLADCIKLLGEGCPTHQVKEVLSRLPEISQKFAKYWICQTRLMEREGNLDVLPMFEKAVGLVVEPVDELRTVVFDILKKKDEKQEAENTGFTATSPETLSDPMMTPKPSRALICAEKGNSSVVKYKITATPGGPPSHREESTVVNGQEVRFFTPVRRSVRIERSSLRYPLSLQDHDLCVSSFNDLIAEEEKEVLEQSGSASTVTQTSLYIYRENEALKDKVSVEFVCSNE